MKPRPDQPPGRVDLLDEKPERLSINHPGYDGANQPPPARRGTLPGGMAAVPMRASGEYQPTLPAPNPLQRQTVQRPAPPSAVALARRTDPPPPVETPVPEGVPSGRAEAREALLEAELVKERAKRQELERQARVLAETKSPAASYPPPVAPAPAPAPLSQASLETAAIEGLLVWLAKRAAANRRLLYGLITALCLGGGGVAIKTATEKTPPPDGAVRGELAAVTSRLAILEAERAAALAREVRKDALIRCLRSQYDDAHQQTLPAPDRMGTAQKPRPWKDDCGPNP